MCRTNSTKHQSWALKSPAANTAPIERTLRSNEDNCQYSFFRTPGELHSVAAHTETTKKQRRLSGLLLTSIQPSNRTAYRQLLTRIQSSAQSDPNASLAVGPRNRMSGHAKSEAGERSCIWATKSDNENGDIAYIYFQSLKGSG